MPNETFLIDIPKESDFMKSTEYDYWKAREKRMFFIDYSIDETYELIDLGKTILTMNAMERNIPKSKLKPIYLFIFSYGGDLNQAWGFVGIMKASRIPIITINMGVAMSAGFLLLISGHKRYTLRYSDAMVHQGGATISGSSAEVKSAQKNYENTIRFMENYILKRTKIPKELYKKKKEKDWYLSPNQQLKYGVVDSIIDDFSMLFDKNNSNNSNRRKNPFGRKSIKNNKAIVNAHDGKFDASKAIIKVKDDDKDESE